MYINKMAKRSKEDTKELEAYIPEVVNARIAKPKTRIIIL